MLFRSKYFYRFYGNIIYTSKQSTNTTVLSYDYRLFLNLNLYDDIGIIDISLYILKTVIFYYISFLLNKI